MADALPPVFGPGAWHRTAGRVITSSRRKKGIGRVIAAQVACGCLCLSLEPAITRCRALQLPGDATRVCDVRSIVPPRPKGKAAYGFRCWQRCTGCTGI